MYPLTRLLSTSVRSQFSKPLKFDDQCTTIFWCRPWDLDMFMEMNNGRVLSLYDLGRFDLSIRSGLWSTLRENRWGLVVAGSTIQYRKRVRMFDRVTMKTQLEYIDDKWMYLRQSMWVRGKPASSVIIRSAVTEKGRLVSPERVRKALNAEDLAPVPSEWLKSWIESEKQRPWPPV